MELLRKSAPEVENQAKELGRIGSARFFEDPTADDGLTYLMIYRGRVFESPFRNLDDPEAIKSHLEAIDDLILNESESLSP